MIRFISFESDNRMRVNDYDTDRVYYVPIVHKLSYDIYIVWHECKYYIYFEGNSVLKEVSP